MKIWNKLLIAFLGFFILILVIGIVLYYQMKKLVEPLNTNIPQSIERLTIADKRFAYMYKILYLQTADASSLGRYVFGNDPVALETYYTDDYLLFSLLQEAKKMEPLVWEKIGKQLEIIKNQQAEILQDMKTNKVDLARQLITSKAYVDNIIHMRASLNDYYQEYSSFLGDVTSVSLKVAEKNASLILINNLQLIMLIVLLAGSISLTAAFFIGRLLKKYLLQLEQQTLQIQKANRLKSEFLANMSHELRTPLNAIIGFTELISSGKVGPVSDQHKEYLGDVLSSARHLLQIINDILDLAKVESGKLVFHPQPILLSEQIHNVCSILQNHIEKKQIKLSTQIDPAVDHVVIDPAKLKQVLYNFMSNALKFTESGGQVEITVTPEAGMPDFFRLSVRDTGIGIRQDDLEKLFVEFQQLDQSSSKEYQGTGLGLSLTRRLVEAQGGRVGVESLFGAGSLFYAVLPREHHKSNEGL